MSRNIVCIREWKDQETSSDALYSIPQHMAELIRKLQEGGNVEEAASLILTHGTPFVPILTIEKVLY